MKKKIFMACAALVVSAAAVLGVKAYNYYSMPALMRANLEALTDDELLKNIKVASTIRIECEKKVNSMCTVICPNCNSRWVTSYDTMLDHKIKSKIGYCSNPNCEYPFVN